MHQIFFTELSMDIVSIIEYFQQKFTSSKFDFSSLKEISENTKSQFIADSVKHALYSFVGDNSIKFNELFKNKDLVEFASEYESFLEKYKGYSSEIDKINNLLFPNNDLIENKEALISYVIIESLSEFYAAKKYIISRKNTKDEGFYTKYFDDVIELTHNTKQFIVDFDKKPYGFYICKMPSQQMSNLFYGFKYIVVGNQPSGLYCYELRNETTKHRGIRETFLEIKNDIFRKRHDFNIEFSESESNALSNDVKNSVFPNLMNELVFKCFLHWCNTGKKEIKAQGVIGYTKNKSGKSNFPVVANFNSTEIKSYTFDELRFSGEYAHLSFFDDLFEDIIDMDYVNYFSDNINEIHAITHMTEYKEKRPMMDFMRDDYVEPEKYSFSKNYAFTKDFYNKLKIVVSEKQEIGKIEALENDFSLTTLNPYVFGNKEDVEKYNLNAAKINKLKLYQIYIDLYLKKHYDTIESELKDYFMSCLSELMSDIEFFKTVPKVGVSNISNRNLYESFLFRKSFINIITQEDVQPYNNRDLDFASISQLDVNTINFVDYTGKNKAHKMIGFDIKNVESMDHLMNKFDNEFSAPTKFFINMFYAYYKSKEAGACGQLGRAFNNIKDPESYNWFTIDSIARLIVPISNKNSKSLLEMLENESIEIQDCTYGLVKNCWF